MPTYHPLATTVQLYSCPLSKTTTVDPERRKAGFSTSEAAKAEKNIKGGRLLAETAVPCCGESSRLHFLGLNKEVPFYLMHVGGELFGTKVECGHVDATDKQGEEESLVSRSSRSSSLSTAESLDHPDEPPTGLNTPQLSVRGQPARRASGPPEVGALLEELPLRCPTAHPSRAKPPESAQTGNLLSGKEFEPQAIGLVLTTTSRTYLPTFDVKQTAQDVKVDVFYNGELVECISIPARLGNKDVGPRSVGAKVQLISGHRMDALIERPWVIVPPHRNADGSLRSKLNNTATNAGAKDRWAEIGRAIMREAELQGFNRYGDCTPTGSYLASLANLNMPEAVERMQKLGGPKFGVIDVVVTAGVGKKGGPDTFYVKEPTRLVDENFQRKHRGFDKGENEAPVSCTAFADPSNNAPILTAAVFRDAIPRRKSSKAERALLQSFTRYTGKVNMIGPERRLEYPVTDSSSARVNSEDIVMQDVNPASRETNNDVDTTLSSAPLKYAESRQLLPRFSTHDARLPEIETAKEDERMTDGVVSAMGIGHGIVASPKSEPLLAHFANAKEPPTNNEFSSFRGQTTNGGSALTASASGLSFGGTITPTPSSISLSFGSTAPSLSAFSSFETTTVAGLSSGSPFARDEITSTISFGGQSPTGFCEDHGFTVPLETSNVFGGHKEGHNMRGDSPPAVSIRVPGILAIETPAAQEVYHPRTRADTKLLSPKTTSTAPAKRRRADAIALDNPDSPAKRCRSLVAKDATTPISTTVDELSVTRRGVFNRSAAIAPPLKRELKPENEGRDSKISAPPSRAGSNRVNRSKTAAMISRIVIECRGVIIVDKLLNPPLPLQRPDRGISGRVQSAPLFPLDESIVFSLKNTTKLPPAPFVPPSDMKPNSTPKQTQTPVPSTSPAHASQSSPSRKQSQGVARSVAVPAKPLPPIAHSYVTPKGTTHPALEVPTSRRRDKVQVEYAQELKDAWVTPELSKDCVLSYVEEGDWVDERGAGVLRHVKSARPGWFVESEVLFAVRYLAG